MKGVSGLGRKGLIRKIRYSNELGFDVYQNMMII